MAKIKNEDIFDGNLLKPTVDEFKALLKITVDLKKSLKKLAEGNEQLVKKEIDLTKIRTEEIKKYATAEKESLAIAQQKKKVDAEEARLKQQLAKAEQEEVKTKQQNLKLEVQERKEKERQEKIAQKELKNQEKLNSVYAKQSKRLNELRKKYKDQRLEAGKSTKETEELRKEIEELDKALKDVDAEVGQFQRNVGNYPKVTEKAKGAIGSWSGFLIGVFVTALTKSRQASREYQIALEKLGTIARTVVNGLVELWQNKIFPTLENFVVQLRKTRLEASLFFKELTPEAFRSAELTQEIASLTKEIETLGDTIVSNQDKIAKSKNPLSAEELNKSLEAIKQNLKAIEELGIAEGKFADFRERQLVLIERLRIEEQKYQIQADDNTTSFKDQLKALEQANKARQDRLKLEQELANKEAEFALKRVNINLREAKQKEISNLEDAKRLDLFKNFDKADKVQQQNLTALAESLKTLDAVQGEVATSELERAKQSREIQRDKFEQELDFAIDIFDNQKTINEQLIADEEKTFKERFKILRDTQELNDSSFTNQIKLVEDFTGKKLQLDELVKESDESVIRERLRGQDLDEITQNRILEIIRERKTANQDLLVAEKELSNEFEESAKNTVEARRDLIELNNEISVAKAEENFEKQKELFSEQEDFQQQQFDDALESLEKQKNAELRLLEQSTKRELAELELSEDEKKLIQARADEEKRKILKKNLEERQELNKTANEKILENERKTAQNLTKILDQLTEAQRKQFEKRQSAIDDDVDANQKRQDDIRELALQGNVDAKQNLADLQREQKELRLKQQREEQAQARRELGFTALKTYSANAEKNPDTALQDTVQDIGLLLAFIQSLQGFYEGTDRVGDSMNPALNTGKDDYIVRVDKDEKIFKPEHSKRIGYGMTNEEVVQVVERFKRGELTGNSIDAIIGGNWQDNQQIIGKFDELKNAIDSKPVYMGRDYDATEQAITDKYIRGQRIIREHKKQGGIW